MGTCLPKHALWACLEFCGIYSGWAGADQAKETHSDRRDIHINFLKRFMEDMMAISNNAELRQAIRECYEKIEQFRSYL